jgi:hypothetical protein
MGEIRPLSPACARRKAVRLLLAAQDRAESARLHWGWDCRVTQNRRSYVVSIERLLDQLSSNDADAVAWACHTLTVMGDDQLTYD